MKKVCSGGSIDLVLEVLKNILPITCTPPTPPKQLLDLIGYGSSLIGLPTPIVTINFGDDLLWASDRSEIYMQCAHYVHESLKEFPIDSPKLNFETSMNMFMHFFDPSIPLSLEDFDANVSPCAFYFF
jgi:hypothetical protein